MNPKESPELSQIFSQPNYKINLPEINEKKEYPWGEHRLIVPPGINFTNGEYSHTDISFSFSGLRFNVISGIGMILMQKMATGKDGKFKIGEVENFEALEFWESMTVEIPSGYLFV